MKPLKLGDLIPQTASFKVHSTGKTYQLRPLNLADEAWLQREFGAEVEKIFREMQMQKIIRIVFHQMLPEDRATFGQRKVDGAVDEDGAPCESVIGGAELLASQLTGGLEEKVEIFQALLQTIGVSRAMIDDFEAEAKAEINQKKSATQSKPIGQESSTPSPASTGGRSKRSKGSRSGR